MSTDLEFDGVRGRIVARRWAPEGAPRFVVLLAHGYGEHSGRYVHVAQALTDDGAVVYAPDHVGHGRSEGERVLVATGDMVADLHTLAGIASEEQPGLPVVVIGHSMGGIIATRYVQEHGDGVAALVLSGPVIGGNPALLGLLELDPIPDIPIDPAVLSRDPAVGEAYAADELVWHGPFKRETLETLAEAVGTIAAGPKLALPTLWIHGEEDQLAPYEVTREAVERIRGDALEEKVYPGAQHEIFNETNKDEVIGDVRAFLARTL